MQMQQTIEVDNLLNAPFVCQGTSLAKRFLRSSSQAATNYLFTHSKVEASPEVRYPGTQHVNLLHCPLMLSQAGKL